MKRLNIRELRRQAALCPNPMPRETILPRVLITGHRGLLGSACRREFAEGNTIIISDLLDCTNREDVRKFFYDMRPNIVIHCAAQVGGVKANRDNPVDFLLRNLEMQNNVISVAHDSDVDKLCFVGTSCMFPRDATLPVEENSLFTGKLEDSVEAYAIAKIAGWRLCKAYWEEYGDRFITVAPSNIYGLGDQYSEDAHVIPSLIRRFHEAVVNKTNLEVWGNGTAVREFIYADDVAKAIRLLLEKWDSPEVVNIGTGVGTDISELVSTIALASPYEANLWPKIMWNPDAPTGIPRKTFSIKNLTGLGWKPQYSLSEGLHKTWFDFMNTKPRGYDRSNQQPTQKEL